MITYHQVNANPPFFRAVTALGELADSSDLSYRGRVVGVTTPVSVPVGTMPVAHAGESIFNMAWTWTRGSNIYLNGPNLSHVPPSSGFVLQMGWGLNYNTMVVNVRDVSSQQEQALNNETDDSMWQMACRNNVDGVSELYLKGFTYIKNVTDGLAYRIGCRNNIDGDVEFYLADTGIVLDAPSTWSFLNESTGLQQVYGCRDNIDGEPELYAID